MWAMGGDSSFWSADYVDRRLSMPGDLTDNDIEHGRKEDAEEGHAQHAVEDDRAQRLPHLGAGTAGREQGKHAEDEGEAGHQDGTQAQARCFDGGVEGAAVVLVLMLLGELDV